MRPVASLLLVGLLSATPVLAQTEQETVNTNGSEISCTVAAPSLGLQSWTPTLAPMSAADLMVMPLAERLAFSAADSLAGPEPAPMSKGVKIGLIVFGILVVIAGALLIACLSGAECA